jgi:dihydroflavonol-4-reductase
VSLAVVTGASGHLGANVVRALLERGRKVRCLVRSDVRALEGLEVERVPGDLSDSEGLRRAFDGAASVFHLAAHVSIIGSEGGKVERANVDGVRHVLEACRAAGVRRLVHFSSIQALHDSGTETTEDNALANAPGRAAYDASKAAGEQLVLESGLDAVIVTPTAVIGPFDFKPSRAGLALIDLARGRVPALLDASFDWVDARDVALGALVAEEKGTRGRRYILSGARASLAELAQLVHAAGGAPPPRFTVPVGVAAALAPLSLWSARLFGTEARFTPDSIAALKGHRQIVPRRSITELAWAPRALDASVAQTLEWFRKAGRL